MTQENVSTMRRRISSVVRQRIQTTLLDGRRVALRPVTSDDGPKIQAGMRRLSAMSKLYRFGSPDAQLSDADLAALNDLDYYDRFAWGAESLEEPGRPGVGAARYTRDTADPSLAHIQITVIDEYQDLGLGTILLFVLAESAVENGIRRFTARVDDANEKAVRLLRRLGATSRRDRDAPERVFTLPLEFLAARGDLATAKPPRGRTA